MIFLYQMLLDEFGVFPVDDVYSFLLAGDTRVDSLKLPFDFVDDSTCSESLMIVSKTLIYMSLMMTAVFMFSLLTFFCYLSLVAFIRYKLRSKWTLFFTVPYQMFYLFVVIFAILENTKMNVVFFLSINLNDDDLNKLDNLVERLIFKFKVRFLICFNSFLSYLWMI